MKLFRSALLLLGETAALGWFLLRDIPFTALLPLIPLGMLFCCFCRFERIVWMDFLTSLLSAVLVSYAVCCGVFDGKGFWVLLLLIGSVSVAAIKVPKEEMQRISGWWMAVFIGVFTAMMIATFTGIRLPLRLPENYNFFDIILFYFLVFAEPLGMGKDYRSAPLALGFLLIPFGLVSYLALGSGAFSMAEYPYLSVWAGVSVSSFHHLEGIILCLYYGAGALRLSSFLSSARFLSCNPQKFIV